MNYVIILNMININLMRMRMFLNRDWDQSPIHIYILVYKYYKILFKITFYFIKIIILIINN